MSWGTVEWQKNATVTVQYMMATRYYYPVTCLDVGIGSAASIYVMATIHYPVTLKPASALERYYA